MRALYTLAWLLLLPLAFTHLLWRARRQPAYRLHWRERLGLAPCLAGQAVIWVHAVSVGETRAAAPLVAALKHRYPDHTLLLTHGTPTGREAGAALFGEGVIQAYLPYDLPWLVHAFIKRTRPRLGIVLETEIWANLLAVCQRRGIPVFLVNARLSERSARGYALLGSLAAATLRRFAAIAAQSDADARRLEQLGARDVRVCGNLKFDVPPPPDTAQRAEALRRLWGDRWAFLAASTREGEEALILDAVAGADLPGLLLVIVPRHPQRFAAVARLIRARGLTLARRGEGQAVAAETAAYLGDSMGEMAAYYAACDLALVGGSLLPHGGQNLIEAAAAGKPLLLGPHTWNFAAAAEAAVACGAALRVRNGAELADRLRELHGDPARCREMGAAGQAFARAHAGATERIVGLLEPWLQ